MIDPENTIRSEDELRQALDEIFRQWRLETAQLEAERTRIDRYYGPQALRLERELETLRNTHQKREEVIE